MGDDRVTEAGRGVFGDTSSTGGHAERMSADTMVTASPHDNVHHRTLREVNSDPEEPDTTVQHQRTLHEVNSHDTLHEVNTHDMVGAADAPVTEMRFEADTVHAQAVVDPWDPDTTVQHEPMQADFDAVAQGTVAAFYEEVHPVAASDFDAYSSVAPEYADDDHDASDFLD